MEPSNYCCHYLYIAVGLIICVNIILVTTKNRPSLISLTVMFRHGDRLPQPYPHEFYPTDPYINHSFHPIELGGLTSAGKMREYQIGKFLRNEYNDFLGEFYRTSDVLAMSSDVDRTKQSLLLALAGLYPPRKGQAWNDELNWQPIPIRFTPSEIDLGLYVQSCPRHEIELARIKKTREYRMAQVRFAPLMRQLAVHMGRDVNDTSVIYYLYLTLKAESSMGLELPKWTKSYFPDGPLKDVMLFQYEVQSFTPLLKKLNGGVRVRLFLNSVKPIVEHSGNNTPKVNLYSVHETHIAGIMKTLKLWNDDLPEYSSAVIFELHEINSKYFVRILYYKGTPSVSEVRVLPGCKEYCPYEDFVKLTKDVVPDDIMEACLGPPENSLLVPRGEDPVKWMYKKFRSWFQFKK